jgi:hypothetical protein
MVNINLQNFKSTERYPPIGGQPAYPSIGGQPGYPLPNAVYQPQSAPPYAPPVSSQPQQTGNYYSTQYN